jgi:protein-S-isoprenylcysteine O-methyltransferase Ste14
VRASVLRSLPGWIVFRARFALPGVGTPAPVAPTEHLVVRGLYVHWYEEPTLRRQFGAEYEAYRRAVLGWWPRRR